MFLLEERLIFIKPAFDYFRYASATPTASFALPTPELTRQVSVHLLDDPQEWSSFSRLDAKNAGCWESNLMIEGMHCAACALTIEDVLLRVPGVVNAEVSAGSHRARVVWAADAVLPSGWMRAMVRRTCFGRWQGQGRTLGYWRIVEFFTLRLALFCAIRG